MYTYYWRMETVPSLREYECYLLSRVGKSARGVVAAYLAKRHLTMRHMAIMSYLADIGPAAQRDIGRLLTIDPSDMVTAIDELQARSLVRRDRDPDDRRRYRVNLTPAGLATLTRCRRQLQDANDALLAPLSARERKALMSALGKLFDAM